MNGLFFLSIMGIEAERIREILEAGNNPNIVDEKHNTPLHYIASRCGIHSDYIENDLQMAGELIRFGANVNARNRKLRTPLILAVRAQNYRMVEFLLQANANINMGDERRNTALHYIFHFNIISYEKEGDYASRLQTVKILLKFHPELDVLNTQNETILMLAVKHRNFPIVKCLLKHNASVNIVNSRNESVLHYAFRYNVNMDIVEELLRHGSDFDLINEKGQTPIDIYINGLLEYFSCETCKIKSVFKIYIFLQNTLSSSQQQDIERISSKYNNQLPQFIGNCKDELMKMLCDELEPNYYVHNIALFGFLKSDKNDNVSSHVFDKVLDKIIKGGYPVYCDLVISGIFTCYLKKKFAEICSVGNTGREFLKFDVLYDLSLYLSESDMLSMMVAVSANLKWDLISSILDISSSRKTSL